MDRGRPREFDSEEVLDAAIAAFWRDGFVDTGVAELTAEMGIGRQSLYNAFGDKRAVFVSALRRYCEQKYAFMEEQLSDEPKPVARLRELLHEMRQEHSRDCAKGCLAINSIPLFAGKDPEIEAILTSHAARLCKLLETVFRRAQKSGELAVDLDCRQLAGGFMVLLHGMALHIVLGGADDALNGAMALAEYLLKSD